MYLFKLLSFCCLLFLVLCEEDVDVASNDSLSDVNVEFSHTVADRPIENAKNASIVTSDEIETRFPYNLDQNRQSSPDDANSSTNLEKNISLGNDSNSVEGASSNSTGNSTEAKNKTKVECTPRVLENDEMPTVILANGSVLAQALSANRSGECAVVLFYSSRCVFSARMAPHFNALPRVFPDIRFYAVDVTETGNLYVRYGLVYVPNVMLFHNSKPFARCNETVLNLNEFVKFIGTLTGLQHNGTLNVTSVDMTGPVPTVLSKRVDWVLVLAWVFLISCLVFGFARSSACKGALEFLRNTWHEANPAQHEHED